MNWGKFEESPKELPEIIIEKIIDGFSDATGQLAQLDVVPLSDLNKLSSKLPGRFQFNINLTSQNISDYSFKVFQIGYNITLYPVSILIAQSILNELEQSDKGAFKTIGSQEELQLVVKLIFETQKFKEIIAGLMKIARHRDNPFSIITPDWIIAPFVKDLKLHFQALRGWPRMQRQLPPISIRRRCSVLFNKEQ